MINKITYIKDVMNQNYLGIQFDQEKVKPFLKEMMHFLGEQKFEVFLKNQKLRDKENYHLTVVNVFELNKLMKKFGTNLQDKIQNIMEMEITDLKFEGIGTATNGTDRAVFVVVNSDTLDEVRNSLGLNPKDFHITLGFDKKDVFGVRKNKVLEKENSFHRKINELKKRDGNSWVFDVKNLPKDLKDYTPDDVEELSLNENSIEFRIDNKIVEISPIEYNGKETLWVCCYY
jgi:2'-5' RNA ligase